MMKVKSETFQAREAGSSGLSPESGIDFCKARMAGARMSLDGTVTESATLAGSFEAIWWVKAGGSIVRMDTRVPAIFIGSADLTLASDPSCTLGQLIGGSSAGFPVLQQFNIFVSAHLGVSVGSP